MRNLIRQLIKEFYEGESRGGENHYFRRLFEWCKNLGFNAMTTEIPFTYDLYKDYESETSSLDHRFKMTLSTDIQSPYLDFDYTFVDFEEGEVGNIGHAINFVSLDDTPGIELRSESDLENIKDMIRTMDDFFRRTNADDLYKKYDMADMGTFNVLVHSLTQKPR